jgi:hypothetical protein
MCPWRSGTCATEAAAKGVSFREQVRIYVGRGMGRRLAGHGERCGVPHTFVTGTEPVTNRLRSQSTRWPTITDRRSCHEVRRTHAYRTNAGPVTNWLRSQFIPRHSPVVWWSALSASRGMIEAAASQAIISWNRKWDTETAELSRRKVEGCLIRRVGSACMWVAAWIPHGQRHDRGLGRAWGRCGVPTPSGPLRYHSGSGPPPVRDR